jgi:hypothetical protein
MALEVVEIDPAVVYAATHFLGFPTQVVGVSDLCTRDSEAVALALRAAADRDGNREGGRVPVTLGDAAAFMESKRGVGAGTATCTPQRLPTRRKYWLGN